MSLAGRCGLSEFCSLGLLVLLAIWRGSKDRFDTLIRWEMREGCGCRIRCSVAERPGELVESGAFLGQRGRVLDPALV